MIEHTLGFVCEFEEEVRGEFWKKGKSKWKKHSTLRGEDFRGLIFLHNTKPFSFEGTKKLYWRRVLEGLYEFIKFILCCYNIHNIKSIWIICISLSFFKKTLFLKNVKKFSISFYISHPKNLPSPPLQTLKQSLRE